MAFSSIPEILKDQSLKQPEAVAIIQNSRNLPEMTLTYAALWKKIEIMAEHLNQIGVQRGCKVAIWSQNRAYWLVSDIAIQLLGAVTVPIYTTLSKEEIAYILNDCSARVLITENIKMLENLEGEIKNIGQLWAAVLLDRGEDKVECAELKCYGMPGPESSANFSSQTYLRKINPEDTATIIYTSGTTGFPKGVMLSHSNFIRNIEEIIQCLPLTRKDRHLSFLPLSHVFERTCGNFLMMSAGATVVYANGVDDVISDAKKFKPTFIMAVPRFYEKVMVGIREKISGAPESKRKLIAAAGKCAIEKLTSRRSSIRLNALYFLYSVLVFSKFKKALGGKVRFCVSGGAPLKAEIGNFFLSIGIVILEGYGLTETSPVIALNRIEKFRFGTVGIPMKCANVNISEEGEIMTSGLCVMKGYYHLPNETACAMEGGQFHTGDLGHIDSDGFLVITGRKKDLIVLSGGKKLCPTTIEEKIEGNPFITRCILYGDGKNFISALILPDYEAVSNSLGEKIIPEQASENLKLRDFIRNELELCQSDLARFEKIKEFEFLCSDFSVEAGELTPTLKMKRNIVWDRYGHLLHKYYNNTPCD